MKFAKLQQTLIKPIGLLSEDQIVTHLRSSRTFLGTFPRDKLPRIPVKKRKNYSLIINTDKDGERGEHWRAVYLTPTTVEYFDPLGFPPLDQKLQRFLDKHSRGKGWQYCVTPSQHLLSNFCGYFCIKFIRSRDRGKSYKTFAGMFSNNLLKNDKIVSANIK